MEADNQHICRYDRRHFYKLTIRNKTAKQILPIQMCKFRAYLKHMHDFYIDEFDIQRTVHRDISL
jgi:hypothetical protein